MSVYLQELTDVAHFGLNIMKNYDKLRAILIKRNKSIKQRESVRKAFFQDLTGKRFNRLVVIKVFEKRNNGGYTWVCKCDCGKITYPMGSKLKSGKTKSCGCFNKERINKHGMGKTRFNQIYRSIKYRCSNPRASKFHLYGGKGIQYEWKSFEEFKKDMYESYCKHVKQFGEYETQIDRIDSDKNYCFQNCRWVTRLEQGRNVKTSIPISFYGETMRLPEWAEKLGINKKTLANRIYAGWPVEKAFTTKIQ